MRLNVHRRALWWSMSLKQASAVAASLTLALVLAASASAQDPEKPTNLKVLDSTISHDQLIALMQQFSAAIGSNCDYCHVNKAGDKGHDMDFASDQKQTKLTARAMMQMVSAINGSYISKLKTDSPKISVQCVTCHRGLPKPVLLADLLKQTLKAHGMAAVDSTYRDLRKNYYGSGSFDFGERALIELAFDVSEESDSNAMAILNLNKEFYPQSSSNEWALGKIYQDLGDNQSAIAQFKKALEINPNNRRAQRDLEAATAGKKP